MSASSDDVSVGWLTLGEVIAWVAFRIVLPFERWDDAPAYQPSRNWGVIIADGRVRNGRQSDGNLIAALSARASGAVWRPTEPPPCDRRLYRATARALLAKPGANADAIIAQIRADEAKIRSADEEIDSAQIMIRNEMARGRLRAYAHQVASLSETGHDVLKEIPRTVFAEHVHFLAQSSEIVVDSRPGGYVHVRFAVDDVMQLWEPIGATRAQPDAMRDVNALKTEALEWMTAHQRDFVARHGKPMDCRSLGRVMAKTRPAFSARWADELSSKLPPELRNPSRAKKGA